jgi:regulator of protease activity HflC (stomatin/prohibitin superfamily)
VSYGYEESEENIMKYIISAIVGVILLAVIGLAGCPTYNVYASQMSGRAAYVKAEQDRRVKVLEAQAALDSAQLNAQAEVARARGTNEANRIMSDSLGGPDNYLRWSYINMLQETAGSGDRQIIYLPTEAGMPILEAGRRPNARPAAE